MTTAEEYARRRAEYLSPVDTLSAQALKSEVSDSLAGLAAALEALSPAQAVWKPDEEEWSAAEVGDHVSLSTGVLGKIAGMLAAGRRPADEDWDPPPRFRGDAGDLHDIRTRLNALPAYAEELFNGCLAGDRMDVTAENSFLGEMNWRQWYYFLRVHALSHVEQIEKLRGTAGFPG